MLRFPPSRIEVFRPALGEEEIDAVAAVMRSGWIGRGPKVAEFEQEWARYLPVPVENMVSLNCATEALYQVMAWIGKYAAANANVIIPGNAYIGTVHAALAAGLTVKLCDVDPSTLNPTANHIRRAIDERTVAVVIQHYGGVPSEQEWIGATVSEYENIYLIEDCACAPYSMFYGTPSGCTGDFGIWSFDAMKVVTAGDGGMLYCRDAGAAADIRESTLLGMNQASGQSGAGERWWEFTVRQPARRAIMNDVQAAIGLVQISRMPEVVRQREDIWDAYQLGLARERWLYQPANPEHGVRSSYYTYWVQTARPEHRDALAVYLRERGIYTTYRYWPVHRAYKWELSLPGVEWAADHTLNLPLHPGLSDDDVSLICETIAEFGRTI